MTLIRRNQDVPCPRVEWMDPSGCRWSAILIRQPRIRSNEYEIQVEADMGMPERILCIGPLPAHFPRLSWDDLELIRRAARARSGILWLDPRDGELWWVHQEVGRRSEWRVLYSSSRWTETVDTYPPLPVALLGSAEHQRLLDDARSGGPREVLESA